MAFDPEVFLARYADAFNARDPEALRSFFALDDPRFAVFEDFSDELFDGEGYGAVLEAVFEATAEVTFELLRCETFGELATIHGIQKIVDSDEAGTIGEALVRSTLLVSLAGAQPRIVSAHFSAFPTPDEGCCPAGGCGEHG